MSRGGITSTVVENSVVPLGDNEFKTGVINVPANTTIKKGVVLKRDGTKFAPVVNSSDKPIAVNPFDVPNTTNTAADLSIRAIISGPVRADLLTINGEATTDAQNDMLRDMSIVPVDVNDISRTE